MEVLRITARNMICSIGICERRKIFSPLLIYSIRIYKTTRKKKLNNFILVWDIEIYRTTTEMKGHLTMSPEYADHVILVTRRAKKMLIIIDEQITQQSKNNNICCKRQNLWKVMIFEYSEIIITNDEKMHVDIANGRKKANKISYAINKTVPTGKERSTKLHMHKAIVRSAAL